MTHTPVWSYPLSVSRLVTHLLLMHMSKYMPHLRRGCEMWDECPLLLALKKWAAMLWEELSVPSCSWEWHQPTGSKNMDTSVPQLRGTESCHQPHELGRGPRRNAAQLTMLLPCETLSRAAAQLCLDFWPIETEIMHVCCFKLLNLWRSVK